MLEGLRGGERCICEIVPEVHGEDSNISPHISLMRTNHLITPREDGVIGMVKVKDPEVFEILDKVSILLKKQLREQRKLLATI